MLKQLTKMSMLDRELYVLQVLMYHCEKEIVKYDYQLPSSETFKKNKNNAEEIVNMILYRYDLSEIKSSNKCFREFVYLIEKCDFDLDEYFENYCKLKGRLPLNEISLGYKKPWWKMSLTELFHYITKGK